MSNYIQWQVLGGAFAGAGASATEIPAGIYEIQTPMFQPLQFSPKPFITDELLLLPNAASEQILETIRSFWDKKAVFQKLGLVHKRGVMLHGEPGTGKTATVELLSQELVKRGGIVLNETNPRLLTSALEILRAIEPNRPVICILEDLDTIIEEYGESELLSLLDGENQVGGVVYLATTNFYENLPERLRNRPSRFDEVIEVGRLTAEQRAFYLRSKLDTSLLSDADLATWVADSEGFPISHLKELMAAVVAIGSPYAKTLARLKGMQADAEDISEAKELSASAGDTISWGAALTPSSIFKAKLKARKKRNR